MEELIDSVKQLDLNIATKGRSSPRARAKAEFKPWLTPRLKTGIIFDDFMAKHECLWTKSDECPQRYECVRDRFIHYGLVDKCLKLEPEHATREQILLAHEPQYYELIESTRGETDLNKLKAVSEKYDGVYLNEHSFDTAMLAAGCCLKLTDAVLQGEQIRNGFALVRTPGHHAQAGEANGFCIFNNAAIVAKHCLQKRGLKRVMIIDWDVHHGQGTQSFFYDDPNVLYVSIHRYELGKYWPELAESNFNFTGAAKGKGFNLNLPLNETGCNDADFLLMWFNVILPVAYEFEPELVIISAGFDAAIGCPEGKMRVKPTTYHLLTHSLMALANGKVVALLEGGYNLLSLAESAANTLRALLGYPAPLIDERFVELSKPHKSVVETILNVIWAIRPQWKWLSLQGTFERFKPDHDQTTTSPGGDSDHRPKHRPVALYEGKVSYQPNKPEKYDLEGVCCPKNEAEQAVLHDEIQLIIDETDMTANDEVVFEKRTLLMLDDHMILHECHESHPEKPARYKQIKSRLLDTGLLGRCVLGKSRKASEEEIAAVHSRKLIELMKETKMMSRARLLELASTMDSIYINNATYDCALLAAGCAIEAVRGVLSGESCNAFALIRPPGHHASRDAASGFCFFNNVVVAARYALSQFPDTCKRVLIFDYDFHHGNGVQQLVQQNHDSDEHNVHDDNILYISVHGYNDANEYPNDRISDYKTGSKNIVNIPWNDDKMGDPEYMMALLSIVLPCAYEFNPDLVLVSSGFDAAINDPLGRYKVSPAAFGHFVHHLMALSSGRLVACLEGGYNLASISDCAAHVVSALLGDPPQALTVDREPSDAAIPCLRNVVSYHKSNYKLLCLDYDLPTDEVES